MRRIAVAFALAGLTSSLFAAQPASAHTPDFVFGAFQVAFSDGTEEPPGLAGYLSVPAQAPVSVGTGATTDGTIASIANHDPVPHTFAECLSACDTAAGVPTDAHFAQVLLPAMGSASTADITRLNAALGSLGGKTIILMCGIHTYMRATLHITTG